MNNLGDDTITLIAYDTAPGTRYSMRGGHYELLTRAGCFFSEIDRVIDYHDGNGGFRALVMIGCGLILQAIMKLGEVVIIQMEHCPELTMWF